MSYTVKLTDYAIEQMKDTVSYISHTLKEPETALAWSQKLQTAIKSLDEMPSRFQLVEDEPWHSEGIWKMLVNNFIVYYWTDEENLTVWVTAVVYGRRD